MHPVTLVCWSCGNKVSGTVKSLPAFGFEIAAMAMSVGWLGYVDLDRSRTLVFCSVKCADDQRTKTGAFRFRAKKDARKAVAT